MQCMEQAESTVAPPPHPAGFASASAIVPHELTILMPCLNEARTLVTCIAKAQAFFDAACAPGVAVPTLRTRHPSNDMRRGFMRDGSHFVLTADRVDWWAL